MAWTDERIAALRELHIQGLSGSQIAAELGDVTRNAVIGKIHRMGLQHTERKAPFHRNTPTKHKRSNPAERYLLERPADGTLPDEPDPPPVMAKCSLMELTARSCRWPVGSPSNSDFFFCGNPTAEDKLPYCDYHTRIAYSPRAQHTRGADRYWSKYGT